MTTKTPPRPTLNPIAEYFGLQRMPFGRNLPVADLLELPGQGEMNARLHQAVREQGIALVTGRGGCGKSTALRRFAESLDPNAFKVLYVPNPGPGGCPRRCGISAGNQQGSVSCRNPFKELVTCHQITISSTAPNASQRKEAVGHRSPVEVLTGSDQGLYQMAGMCSLENLNPGKETP